MAAGIETGANSSMLLERNTVNPTSRLGVEAGVIARCAVEVMDRGSWRKQRPFVMERIGAATGSRRASGQTSSRSCVTRKLAEPAQKEIANERGVSHVCILWQDATGEPVRLVQMCVSGQRAASVYRQGHAGNSGVDRPCLRGALQWLEPDDGKPSCPVLRGGSGSNATSLPDRPVLRGASGSNAALHVTKRKPCRRQKKSKNRLFHQQTTTANH